jgi:hemoglobin
VSNDLTPSLYQQIGAAKLREIVQIFYPLVKADPLLTDLFPENLSETMNKQEAFYHQTYGHPMLRGRHMKFRITIERARAWFECFSQAVNAVDLEPGVRIDLLEAVGRVAGAMINSR